MLNIPLINTHTHAAMVAFRGKAEDFPLDIWLNEYIWPMEKKFLTPEFIYNNTRLAIKEMKKYGIKGFADMYFCGDEVCQAIEQEEIYGIIADCIIGFPTISAASPKIGLVNAEKLINKYKGNKYAKPCVGAHSIYTVSQEYLIESKKIANQYNTIYQIHLSETQKEYEECLKTHGKTPTRYLHDMKLLDENTLLAHCVWMNDDDIKILAETKANVSHCPLSNLKLGSGIAPIAKMIEYGVNVTIGTDGAASSNRLDVWEAGKFAALLQKGINNDPSLINTKQVVKMMSINGMKALKINEIEGKTMQDIEKIIEETNYNFLYEKQINEL